MTQEDIEKMAARAWAVTIGDVEHASFMTGYINGIADYLGKVWHDVSEAPKENNARLLAECTLGDDDRAYGVFEEEDWKCWPRLVELWQMKRWAYVSDLLPEGGES